MTQHIHAWMVRAGNSNELAELVEGRSPDHMTTLREASDATNRSLAGHRRRTPEA